MAAPSRLWWTGAALSQQYRHRQSGDEGADAKGVKEFAQGPRSGECAFRAQVIHVNKEPEGKTGTAPNFLQLCPSEGL